MGKDIDRMAGAERETVGLGSADCAYLERGEPCPGHGDAGRSQSGATRHQPLTAPATPEAARWQGWGSALKPSWEPVVVARKPLAGTLAGNVLAWGTGALNINGTRLDYVSSVDQMQAKPGGRATSKVGALAGGSQNDRTRNDFTADNTKGRWPPNVALIHGPSCRPVGVRKVRGNAQDAGLTGSPDGWGTKNRERSAGYADPNGLETVAAWDCQADCPVRLLDEASGATSKTGRRSERSRNATVEGTTWGTDNHRSQEYPDDAGGGASRFMATFPPDGSTSRTFYTAKAPTAERVTVDGDSHATVKPLALMRWLVRMVTPPDGIVLDLFCGSGTTGEAAMLEGFRSILVDLDMASCRKAMVRTDPHVRRRGPIVTDNQGRLVEEGEADAPRLF